MLRLMLEDNMSATMIAMVVAIWVVVSIRSAASIHLLKVTLCQHWSWWDDSWQQLAFMNARWWIDVDGTQTLYVLQCWQADFTVECATKLTNWYVWSQLSIHSTTLLWINRHLMQLQTFHCTLTLKYLRRELCHECIDGVGEEVRFMHEDIIDT